MSEPTNRMSHDLAVIGGGSAGFAAALAAARRGLKVAVVESNPALGGTATRGGVNCWESGVGGTGIPFDLFRRVKRDSPSAVGISSFGRHFCWQDGCHWPHALDKVNFPGGELLIDPSRGYSDTLRRHPDHGQQASEAWCRERLHGVPFLPEAMETVQRAMLDETRNVTLLLNTSFTKAQGRDGFVESATLDDGTELRAELWLDCAAGAFCSALGCATLRGADPRSLFSEADAPEEARDEINGISLIYKVMPGHSSTVEALPSDIRAECWWAPHFPPMHCVQYPDMGRNCNMLPTMTGKEFIALGYDAAYAECARRVRAHWHFVQTHWPEFRAYRIAWIAPMLGIREDLRVACEKMLTANDILSGLSRQDDPDIIAIADHPFDRHGAKGGCGELREPYGVPFRCLIPKGWRNLLVAGRAAGFSSIAASSCRLTRTMMQLGQAAGTAAVLAKLRNTDVCHVSANELRTDLRNQGVQLEWPVNDELRQRIGG